MSNTVQKARASIAIHTEEIKLLLRQEPVDTLAVEQLQTAIIRDIKIARSAQRLVDTANSNRSNRVQDVLDRLFPRTYSAI